MSDPAAQPSDLSPEAKRALLARLLQERASAARSAYPLAHQQRALWFLYQLAPESPAYNLALAARVRFDGAAARLERVLQKLVDRHGTLRTTFATRADGEPEQRVEARRELKLDETDASGWSETQMHARLKEASRRPFDLERGPVFRASLFRRSPTEVVLLLAVHHIVFDARSLYVLLEEFRSLYTAEATGAPAALAPAPSYADYVEWQAEMLRGPEGARLGAYWEQRLAGELPVLTLPTDRPRPRVQTYAGASYAFELGEDVTRRLRGLARDLGTTLYVTLLAAYVALLHRYSGQAQILVGSPVAGRSRPEFQRTVGYFVNPTVLRADVAGNPSFAELVRQVRETTLAALDHQDYPLPLLVERLRIPRDPSRSPVFQVMFSLIQLGARAAPDAGGGTEGWLRVEAPGLALEQVPLEQEEGQFDLTLELFELTRSLTGVFKYNTDLFDVGTIERMCGHLVVLLEAIVAKPERPVSTLPLLAGRERRQVLEEWNATDMAYARTACVHELVQAQAARIPDRVAVVDERGAVTYRDLNARANRLAHHLRALGVGPDTLVGLCMERSAEMVVGVLGILKAGGAYVPLDPAYPPERLRFMVEDGGVAVLVSEGQRAAGLGASGARVVWVDAEAETIARQPATNLEGGTTAEGLAYVIYTSGSTGKPKGVQIPHRAVVNFLASMERAPGLTERDVLVSVTTLSFDIAGLELYLPLSVGARVVVASRDVATDGARLSELLTRSGATVMQATPATWRLLLEAGWGGKRDLKMLCGGEALSRALAEQLLDRGAALWNMYGPTETTIWSAVERVERGTGPILIGRPIANTQIYVLDEEREPVPIGVAGEVYIGGEGLARGYLGRPELTEDKFVSDPFRSQRLYRTGDQGRYWQDGRLEFLGRLDDQVKVRGYRIELGEIEAVLRQHPSTREAVVVAREAGPGDQRLVAYIVLAPEPAESGPSAVELRSFLKGKLPDYMVPADYVVLEALPLTPNGKVNRRALPEPDGVAAPRDLTFVAPRGPLELQLAQIWEEVIGVSPIGIRDDFFDVGGHSLLAVRLVSRIRDVMGKTVSLAAFFQQRTIEQMAGALDRGDAAAPVSSFVAIQPSGSRPPFYVGGSHPAYVHLARHLGPDQPFYGLDVYALQGQRLEARQKPFRRIEDIAAHFVERIREMQPAGPYFLGGGCEGGIVAFEMAKQLQSQGERIALLAIWETVAPRQLPNSLLRLCYQAYLLFRGQSLFKLSPRALLAVLKHEWVEYGIFRAIGHYTPGVYQGRVVVLSTGPATESSDPTLGWGELASEGADIVSIPGTHATFLTTHAQQLAERLGACLDASAARPESPAPSS